MKRFEHDTDTQRLQIDRSTMYFVIVLTLLSLTRSTVQSYEVSIGNIQNGRPEVNRQSIAGIWKLIPTTSYHRTPMKEFTVYPKKPQIVPPELLLLLKEDGSFQQYQYDTSTTTGTATTTTSIDDDVDTSKNVDIDMSWKTFYNTKTNQLLLQQQHIQLYPWIQSIQTGKWNYLDGYLLLAADRIQSQQSSTTTIDISSSSSSSSTMKSVSSHDTTQSTTSMTAAATSFLHRSNDDTLLKGRVIASYQTRLEDNPIVSSKDQTNITTTTTITTSITKSNTNNNNNNKKIQLDTYLTIPRGTIHIGKFMYPKHHPSFFDQPMYQPIKMGTCTLRQIIGNVNMAHNNNNNNNNHYYDKGSLKSNYNNNYYINQNNYNDDTVVESYHRSDFYNKTFLLTSHPLQTQPVSSSKNDPYSKKRESKTTKSSSSSPSTGSVVRVLQIIFHPNNTFTTTGGLGNDIILRGKYDIIGNNQDHLWMQVIRFGFGRSVSGSVYSEGIMLSHEDIKAYWGTIRKIPYITTNSTSINNKNNSTNNTEFHDDDNVVDIDNDLSESSSFRIEVDGSVLDGIGLEPIPVAQFMLREIDPTVTSTNTIDDDDDDEEEEDDEDSNIEQLKSTIDIVLEDDGIDWKSTDESFQ